MQLGDTVLLASRQLYRSKLGSVNLHISNYRFVARFDTAKRGRVTRTKDASIDILLYFSRVKRSSMDLILLALSVRLDTCSLCVFLCCQFRRLGYNSATL